MAADWLDPELAAEILTGVDPVEDARRAVMGSRAPEDPSGFGLEMVALEWLSTFMRNPEARLRMRLARSAGISYSEALIRWRDPEDLGAEMAFDMLQADDREHTCPNGHDQRLWVDERGRFLDNGPYKITVESCQVCATLEGLQQNLIDESTKKKTPGAEYVIRRREPGELPVEDFD